jgi:hypothetical protein
MKFAMSDARIFTDYTSACSLNAFLQNKYAPGSNEHEYRYFLQRNAETIMKDLSSNSKSVAKCPVCKEVVDKK